MEFKAKKKTIKVTVPDGAVYEMRCPSIGEHQEFVKKIASADQSNATDLYAEFFDGLGLPKSASTQFDSDDFFDLIKFVLNPKKS